jgi:hypothetical protein
MAPVACPCASRSSSVAISVSMPSAWAIGPGDEVVGRGDQGQAVALLAVPLHQGLRGGLEHRLHHFGHEAPAGLRQVGQLRPRQGAVAKST